MAGSNRNLVRVPAPAIKAAFDWIEGKEFPADRPLINLSQAAPAVPPPLPLREAIADAVMNQAEAHLYGPILGLPSLRAEIATQWSASYGGNIGQDNVAITAGCNQAFCAAIATLAEAGDEVILPSPWYFNHKMWLDMSGIRAVPLPADAEMLPSPAQAEALITDQTRAIALVTPNNPCGVEYPADLVEEFAGIARARGLALILDETYRDFDARPGRPHALFSDPDWADHLIHLYSFSKAYRLTGHRVGAMVAGRDRILQAEKWLDTVTICPNQIGQRAALWGMQNLSQWLAGERDEILARRAAFATGFAGLEGWRLLGLGAYFAYVEHPFAQDSETVARALVDQASILALPGTMFAPEGDESAARQMRFAFANIDRAGIEQVFERLGAFTL